MSQVTGGLRQRLVRDSLYFAIHDGLDQLGWFDTDRRHQPVTFVAEPIDNQEPIEPNTLVLFDEDLRETEAELGSNSAITFWTFYVDFYAENNTVGRDLINDVRAIVAGRAPELGRTHPRFDVLDYRLATPVQLFTVDVEDVVVDRASDFPRPWLKHWYACRFTVIDHYLGD